MPGASVTGCFSNGALAFASELRSFLALPWFQADVDPQAIGGGSIVIHK